MADNTVKLTHSNGATVRASKDKVERLERMGFKKSSTRTSSKSSD